MASCYYSAFADQGIAHLSAEKITQNARAIAETFVANSRRRFGNAELLEWRSSRQFGHPVVYVVMRATISTFDRNIEAETHNLITAWKNREISFTCASEVVVALPQYAAPIREQMLRVLRTLAFEQ